MKIRSSTLAKYVQMLKKDSDSPIRRRGATLTWLGDIYKPSHVGQPFWRRGNFDKNVRNFDHILQHSLQFIT
jgi:hypothetical protein